MRGKGSLEALGPYGRTTGGRDLSGRGPRKGEDEALRGAHGPNCRCERVVRPLHENPPRDNARHRTEELPDIQLNAVFLREESAPDGDEPAERLLLTNLPATSFGEAQKTARWHGLRWRIETFFKIMKSGFRAEACGLNSADRLIRYLTAISVVAWRLFIPTLIARAEPDLPCTAFLAAPERKALRAKVLGTARSPDTAPTVAEAVTLIARLGGYPARKCDGPPGTLALWRGWRRLADLAEGWRLAQS